MKLINNLLSGKKDKDALKLRFIKKENIWHVTKGYAIMYMGDKDQCEKYLSHMTA
ncbi:MAG: hypothetical protein NXI20_15100 [bacterium]|nr:hypothetical protein [bacterium]